MYCSDNLLFYHFLEKFDFSSSFIGGTDMSHGRRDLCEFSQRGDKSRDGGMGGSRGA